jgi:hypothetical protein
MVLSLYLKPFLGVPCVVGTTPIHPELGGEKATGFNKLYGSLSGKLNLMPRNLYKTFKNTFKNTFKKPFTS